MLPDRVRIRLGEEPWGLLRMLFVAFRIHACSRSSALGELLADAEVRRSDDAARKRLDPDDSRPKPSDRPCALCEIRLRSCCELPVAVVLRRRKEGVVTEWKPDDSFDAPV